MKKKLSLVILFILISSALFPDVKKFSITAFEKAGGEAPGFSREFFVNNIYLDFMVPFGLDIYLDGKDYVQLFSELYTGISANYPQKLVVHAGSDKKLSILFSLVPVDKTMSLVVTSNYDIAGKKLVPDDGDLSSCYSRQYFIVNNRLIPGHIYYMKDRDSELAKLRNASDYNGIADFYLFDDDTSNDEEISGIISIGLKSTADSYQKSLLRLTESQYHIFRGRFKSASFSLDEAENVSLKITDPAQKQFIQVSVKLMRRILYISRNIRRS